VVAATPKDASLQDEQKRSLRRTFLRFPLTFIFAFESRQIVPKVAIIAQNDEVHSTLAQFRRSFERDKLRFCVEKQQELPFSAEAENPSVEVTILP
jgi:hypothetical protein